MKIEMTGDKQLKAKLDNLGKKELNKIVRQATRKNCKPVQAETKQLVPVESGALAKAVKVRSMKRKKGYVGSRVTIQFAGKSKSNMFYGAFQEYGFTTVNGRKIEGKHFMKNAAINVGDRTTKNTADDIRQGIKQAVKK